MIERTGIQAPLHQVLVSRRVGGAGLVAIALAGAASRRGWPCTTWVPGPGPASDAVTRGGLKHRLIELEATDASDVRRLQTCSRLFFSLARQPGSVVHVHNGWMFGLVRPALRAAGARTIVHFQIDPDDSEIAWTLKRPPMHMVACAHYIARRLSNSIAALGLTTGVTAVPNSVDLERFVPGDRVAARREVAIASTDPFVILTFANLAPHKGQVTAIRAVHGLARRGVSAELWIAGEDRSGSGAYERELRHLAAELNVASQVRFLGFRSDTPRLLQAANVFVLPSSQEGLPLSVLEAQASGLPVIGSDIPGMLEIIEDGSTGFVVSPENIDGYSDRLLALYRDPALGARLVDAAARRVRREHSWELYEDRMFAIYSMIGKKPS